jgi:hypothetical protein
MRTKFLQKPLLPRIPPRKLRALAIRAAHRLDEFDFPRFVHRTFCREHFKSAAACAALLLPHASEKQSASCIF